MMDKLLKIATVTSAHGIGGEVRLKVFLEDDSLFGSLSPFLDVNGDDLGDVSIRGQSKGQFIARFFQCTSRNDAETMKGLNLYIPRKRLPDIADKDEYYYSDLVGLEVQEDSVTVGHIQSVRDHGAGDLIEIKFSEGKTDYFTFSSANFPLVDVREGYVVFVRPTEIISQDSDGQVH